jgi:kynurenine formamidase
LIAPFHRYEHGKDWAEIGPESFADLDAVVIRAPHRAGLAVEVERFRGLDLHGKAVLIHTGWGDEHWNTERYFENHPFVTGQAAECLVAAGAALVGIDSHNIDDTRGHTHVECEYLEATAVRD